jgi:hypothetical protein
MHLAAWRGDPENSGASLTLTPSSFQLASTTARWGKKGLETSTMDETKNASFSICFKIQTSFCIRSIEITARKEAQL